MTKPKILMIVGSLRSGSLNKQLANYIAECLKGNAEVESMDWSEFPLMNQDIEFPAPDAVTKAREQVRESDALWFVSPEYNHGVPGGLKNAIDWLSRPLEDGSASVIIGKLATVSGVGGSACTRYMSSALLPTLDFLKIQLAPSDFTGVCYTRPEVETSKLEITEFISCSVAHQIDCLLDAIEKRKSSS